MYDFWFALGQGMIDPTGFMKAVNAGKPDFYFCPRVSIVMDPNKGPTLLEGPSTGMLSPGAVRGVRESVYAYLKGIYKTYAPPVGLYTAGRICQLNAIPLFRKNDNSSTFAGILNYANGGIETLGALSTLPKFPALLGLCLMDNQLAFIIAQYPNVTSDQAAQMKEILAEFEIDPASNDFQQIQAFVKTQGYLDAQSRFMGLNDDDPWARTGATFEQMMFWTGKSEYAIP